MDSKGNALLSAQFTNLVGGLTFWQRGEGHPVATNPLLRCDFNYLAYKLKVLDRLRQYRDIELCDQGRTRLLYVCSGSDQFCRVVESLGLTVTTVDMCANEYSRRHVRHVIRDDAESVRLLADHIHQHDVVLWDTSIGHLDAKVVKQLLALIRHKTYLIGLYDVPRRQLFGERLLNDRLMVNILRNSPSTNADLYSEILPGSKLQVTVDMGAFSLLLYDNIIEFPVNEKTLARCLEAANSPCPPAADAGRQGQQRAARSIP